MKKALIVVDIQNDFVAFNGTMCIDEAVEIIPYINKLVESPEYSLVVYTMDWHPENHCSFISNNNEVFNENNEEHLSRDIQLWPRHCVQHRFGAELHSNLKVNKDTAKFIYKGTLSDCETFSAFGNEKEETGLTSMLRENGIEGIDVVGVALEYCVYETAIGGIKNGFHPVRVLLEGTAAICPASNDKITSKLRSKNIEVIAS